jgi:two-component system alkaline phosphatase synthesis response regulator PhoP
VDDYIVKPFELTELKARLQSKLKKLCHKSAKENLLLVGDLQIDLASQQVNDLSDNKRALKLTSREFKLLVFFAQNENHVLSRERLLDAVWGSNATTVFDRTIDTHISAIRKKLGKHSSYIESVKGSGYRLRRGGRRNTA